MCCDSRCRAAETAIVVLRPAVRVNLGGGVARERALVCLCECLLATAGRGGNVVPSI